MLLFAEAELAAGDDERRIGDRLKRCAADPELDLIRDALLPREAEAAIVAASGGSEPSSIVERRCGVGSIGILGLVEADAESGCDRLGPW